MKGDNEIKLRYYFDWFKDNKQSLIDNFCWQEKFDIFKKFCEEQAHSYGEPYVFEEIPEDDIQLYKEEFCNNNDDFMEFCHQEYDKFCDY
ncbi:MAG: hypothetical protein R6U15_06545 [Candidatus Izemoplasmatales bacterium]